MGPGQLRRNLRSRQPSTIFPDVLWIRLAVTQSLGLGSWDHCVVCEKFQCSENRIALFFFNSGKRIVNVEARSNFSQPDTIQSSS